MAKFVRATQLIRAFKQSAAPTVAQGLNLDDIWVDTDDHTTYVCTSVSPVTFVALGSGGGTPGGSNTQVQFNDSSAFGGDAGLTYNKTTDTLTAGAFSGPLTGNVTASTWYRLQIVVNSAGNSVTFYRNGTAFNGGAIAQSAPSGATIPYVGIRNGASGTTSNTMVVDYLWVTKAFSTPR